MPETPPDLQQLRRRIDEIDDRLLDLLAERVEIVAGVAATKQNSGGIAAHQPAREAEILRRLVTRNRGLFPPAALVRMWRELLAATVRMQGAFTIAVYAPPEQPGFWDIARDHYGSHTAMLAYGSTGQVIRAVTEGQAAIGVLPMPDEEEPDPWWRHLLSANEAAPHVIARLPFGARGNARFDSTDALAIGRGAPVSTALDRSLFATENVPGISRGRMASTLAALGLECRLLASWEQAETANTLVEIDGFVPVGDPRLERFRAQLGPHLYRLWRLGGYAVPLDAVELELQRPAGGSPPTASAPTVAVRG